jgi:tRNA (guanine-N7-)-methyltransferase
LLRRWHNSFPVIELIPESYVARLDLLKIFGRNAPLQVDLGCGDGSFLCALAARMPEKNFIGVERMLGRVRSATHKASKIGPGRTGNVRILHLETFYTVRFLLPPASVEAFYLLFPDPWPKRRHQRRRIMTGDFLRAIGDALVPDGTFRIATDQSDYFKQIRELAERSTDFSTALNRGDSFPSSAFEKKFEANGASIHRLELRKISPVT